ncbi:MAG: PTS sugar transporter subunit IIA [Planctomycetes bacterium]|nr:PTS sugar transporter subunit IIA [Planctomycetota bacterium]
MRPSTKKGTTGIRLSTLLNEDVILLGFEAADKWQAIERLVDHLVARGRVKAEQRRVVLDALVARENIASTGMEHGVAIPHAQVEGLEEAAGAFAVAPKGVPFGSADGRPALLIALLVIPRRSIKQHIRTLAGIARLLNYEDMRAALLGARAPKDVVAVLQAEEEKGA